MSSSEKDYGDELLAARLLGLRLDLGLSMEAFAAVLGVSQPTQSRIERAKRLPDALYLRRLREHFQVDINALLTGEAVADARGSAALNMALTQSGSGVQVGQTSGPVTVGAPAPRKRKGA